MQNRPDQATLLEAVAQFVLSELAPALEADKALQFRALIAANLANMVAQEIRTESARFGAESDRLKNLLSDVDTSGLRVADPTARKTALASLERVLAQRLRDGSVDFEAAMNHLLATARETLAVTNPRFELSDEVD